VNENDGNLRIMEISLKVVAGRISDGVHGRRIEMRTSVIVKEGDRI
jgi:hypothetical protein